MPATEEIEMKSGAHSAASLVDSKKERAEAAAGGPVGSERTSVDIDEHMLSLEMVLHRYATSYDHAHPDASAGLSEANVLKKREIYGPNQMTPPKQVPLIVQYLICLSNVFNLMLMFSGALCFIVVLAVDPTATPNYYIGAVLFAVAILNALMEFVQEQKSKAILSSFMNLVPSQCMAVREGKIQSMSAIELVPGDVVALRMGDKIPADCLLVKTSEFKVDNSSLTGEAEPQPRKAENTFENPLEATNLAFNGTLAVNGDAYGIVIRTGDETVLGQIAGLAGGEDKRDSPLTVEITSFVHKIAVVAVIVAIVFFVVGLLKTGNLAVMINFAIGVFVSFVPEGLPATVTMLLSIAAARMAKKNVLVKDLRGVETLGAITCLATDKTGTLTRNQMTVTNLWTGNTLYKAMTKEKAAKEKVSMDTGIPKQSVQSKALESIAKFDYAIPELAEMANIAYLCSKAKYASTDVPIKERSIIGDATETGLMMFAADAVPDSDTVRDRFPKVFEIPFNSANKWALTIHEKPHANGHYTLYIKGAPERVFRLCSSFIESGNKVVPLEDSHKAKYQEAYEGMAAQGHRVIGCATLLLPGDKFPKGFTFVKAEDIAEDAAPVENSGPFPEADYTFLGLVSLEDPPKHGVREAIGKCRQAGVKVMMVTGDHPLTAEAIARKINLMLDETKEMVAKRTNRPVASIKESEYHAVVIHGEMIDTLTDADWNNILDKEEIIFARTSPKHKLEIVKRCQARGHIVGVTGDGVNDSPALKKADLGIAMNLSGSDVSKEAASMILLDDNFASVVSGIAEGRLIFKNLKKSIRYTVSHTMPQVIANLLYLVADLPAPMDPLHIIFCDLGFELAISLAYAWEKPEGGPDALMEMLPRKPVTARSIDLLNRVNAAEDAKQTEIKQLAFGVQPVDAEGQVKTAEELSLGQKVKLHFARHRYALEHLFDKDAWDLYWEPRNEDVLVDANTLSFAYIEIGLLETIGCLLAYFFAWWFAFGKNPAAVVATGRDVEGLRNSTVDKEVAYTQSVYYFALFIMQAFNHFLCKCNFELPFGKHVLENRYSWAGVAVGAAVASLIVYAPNGVIPFHTMPFNPICWLIPMGMGIVMLAYGSLRILYMRTLRPENVNLNLPLDLHPTRWSTFSAGRN